jgi:hypothetical protein
VLKAPDAYAAVDGANLDEDVPEGVVVDVQVEVAVLRADRGVQVRGRGTARSLGVRLALAFHCEIEQIGAEGEFERDCLKSHCPRFAGGCLLSSSASKT